MNFNYRYRLTPRPAVERVLTHHIDVCRQVYNHFVHVLHQRDEPLSRFDMQGMLPHLKEWWEGLADVHSKVLQMVVKRVSDNLSRLAARKARGYRVGRLKWKGPQEYRSLTYNQSGFEFKSTNGRSVLRLSKIGDIPIRLHRSLPDRVKQVAVKRDASGEWYAIAGVETDEPPAKPSEPEKLVGIDVGLEKFVHDTNGMAITPLDLSDAYERMSREQRKLARKERGSANWEKQRRVVARCYQRIVRKRRDFLHKLSNYYAREYDLVAVEDLDTKGLVELPSNSRNRSAAAWSTFFQMLKYKCEREATHFVPVEPAGTTKECAKCGVSTDKPLWVREHSCPACGFEADRDLNAAYNVLLRGMDKLGVGDAEDTPPETGSSTDTTVNVVSARAVVERGSPRQ